MLGIDLQQLVHEDMRWNFDLYPARRVWGQERPDTNIDHGRVLNLEVFFAWHGTALPATPDVDAYAPGDLVTWTIPRNLPHIGIVTDRRDPETGEPLIVHNIGRGPVLENMLFDYQITGHYRYLPAQQ